MSSGSLRVSIWDRGSLDGDATALCANAPSQPVQLLQRARVLHLTVLIEGCETALHMQCSRDRLQTARDDPSCFD